MSPRLFGLLGSGEFEQWSEPVDRWLLERAIGDGSVLVLPAASAHEGEEVFDNWARMGLEHYERQGVAAEVLPLKTREDALRADLTGKLDRASMVFFSGGNPYRLADILVETPFWTGVLRGIDRGMAYAGCSAGVASLGDMAPDSDVTDFTEDLWHPGLKLFPKVLFGPHWDALDSFAPGLTDLFISWVPDDCMLFAIDEKTAVVGDGSEWSVIGNGKARLMRRGTWREFGAGESFPMPQLDGD